MKLALLAATAVVAGSLLSASSGWADDGHGNDHERRKHYSHVLLISIDGMHAVDLARWIANPNNAGRALQELSESAVIYSEALTTAPSDSFPGMLAQVTGGTSKSTGVFYDDSYDRGHFAPGSDCSGQAGSEVQYAENIDVVTSRLDGGGTLGQPLTQIDPNKLPKALVKDVCTTMLPHTFVRVNTLFEVLKGHGLHTAWSDKHPAYEILNGPSGTGIDDLFTPEINSDIPGFPGKDNTTSFTATQRYDEVKVQAVLNEINGLDSTGSKHAPVPAILGMNFQSVSVGQKLARSGPTDPAGLVGGYLDAAATPGNALHGALAYVDGAIRRMMLALDQQGLDRDTLIIISAKHGQSPINRTLRTALDDGPYAATPGWAFHIADDVALLWLQPQLQSADYSAAEAYLRGQFSTLGIAQLLTRKELKRLYQDPFTDGRTPDFIALVNHGVIYTGGSKLAEHGGFGDDDRNVALMVSAPQIERHVSDEPVETRQIAPTILKALGFAPNELQAVKLEHTRPLPELGDSDD